MQNSWHVRQRNPENLGIFSNNITGFREETCEGMLHAFHHLGEVQIHKVFSVFQFVYTCERRQETVTGRRVKEFCEAKVLGAGGTYDCYY